MSRNGSPRHRSRAISRAKKAYQECACHHSVMLLTPGDAWIWLVVATHPIHFHPPAEAVGFRSLLSMNEASDNGCASGTGYSCFLLEIPMASSLGQQRDQGPVNAFIQAQQD